MSIQRSIYIAKRIDYLVRMQNTGTAANLAAKLNVSIRSIFNYLEDLKEMGAPISWSYQQNSYIYSTSGKIVIGFRCDNEKIPLAGRVIY